MGLDTVELVYSFERYFKVEFPDAVSETLNTVGDVATYISQQLGVAGLRHSAVRATVAGQLLRELPPGTTEAAPLHQLLADAAAVKTLHYALRNSAGLLLPPLSPPPTARPAPSLWERLTGQLLPITSHWRTQTVAELIDWTVAFNYEKLLTRPPTSQYEVEQAVIGLTSDKSGVSVEEIQLHHSFTNELGMD